MSLLHTHVATWAASPFAAMNIATPWELVADAAGIVSALQEDTGPDYRRDGDALVHRTAVVEGGALLKGPVIVGPGCFVAAGKPAARRLLA